MNTPFYDSISSIGTWWVPPNREAPIALRGGGIQRLLRPYYCCNDNANLRKMVGQSVHCNRRSPPHHLCRSLRLLQSSGEQHGRIHCWNISVVAIHFNFSLLHTLCIPHLTPFCTLQVPLAWSFYTGHISDLYIVVYILVPLAGAILASLLWMYLTENKVLPLKIHPDFSPLLLPTLTLVVGVWAATLASDVVPKSTVI